MEFLVQTYSKLKHGVSHVELQQTVSDLFRYLIEKEDEQKEEKEPVKVGVERPKTLEQESGLVGRLPDMESPMKDSHLGVGLASIPPAIPQSLHLPTEYIQDFAFHVAHCSNCRDLVERHLQYPFRMPVEDANGKHS